MERGKECTVFGEWDHISKHLISLSKFIGKQSVCTHYKSMCVHRNLCAQLETMKKTLAMAAYNAGQGEDCCFNSAPLPNYINYPCPF